MQNQQCDNCRFWLEPSNGNMGQCRRRAPLPVIAGGPTMAAARWPATAAIHWCGEHQATPKDDPLRAIAEEAFYLQHIAGYLADIRDREDG